MNTNKQKKKLKQRKLEIVAQDQELMKITNAILNSDSPALEMQKGLILQVFRIMLAQKWAKERIKLVLPSGQTSTLEAKLYDHIAAVISKTYAELGDVASLADDEALEIIRDMLLRFDPEIIDRNRLRQVRR